MTLASVESNGQPCPRDKHSDAEHKHLSVLLSPALLTLLPCEPEMPCPYLTWQEQKMDGVRHGCTDPISGALTLVCGPHPPCVRLWTRGLICVTCPGLCISRRRHFLEYGVPTGFILEFWKPMACLKLIKTDSIDTLQ